MKEPGVLREQFQQKLKRIEIDRDLIRRQEAQKASVGSHIEQLMAKDA